LRVIRKCVITSDSSLIECVMGTNMPHAKRSIQSEVTIDGFRLIWNLHREQLMPAQDDWTGMAIHVKVAVGVRRELYLEYPVYYKEQRGVKFVDPAHHFGSEGRSAYSACNGGGLGSGVAWQAVCLRSG